MQVGSARPCCFASVNETRGCFQSFKFDRDNYDCQATKVQLPLCENVLIQPQQNLLWPPVAEIRRNIHIFFALSVICISNIFNANTDVRRKSQGPAALSFLIQQSCMRYQCENGKNDRHRRSSVKESETLSGSSPFETFITFAECEENITLPSSSDNMHWGG